MALKPSLAFHRIGSPSAPHVVEIWFDFVCPFSKKILNNLDTSVVKWVSKGGKYDGKVQLLLRPQVQPWHASSTWVHEASIAVGHNYPKGWYAFALALINEQDKFFDRPTYEKNPSQVRDELALLAGEVVSKQQPSLVASQVVGKVRDLITPKTTPNGGVDVTNDLKYFIKLSRQNGIHVSPTALFDGLIENSISSSWGEAEWQEFLEKSVTA